MRILLFVFIQLIALNYSDLFAQVQSTEVTSVEISNVVVRYRNDGDMTNDIPPSVNSPEYQQRKVTAEIIITVSDAENLKEIEIKNGLTNGSTEFLNIKIQKVKIEDKHFLTVDGKNYEIKNNTVTIEVQISERSLDKSSHFAIKATDKDDKVSNTLTKKVN